MQGDDAKAGDGSGPGSGVVNFSGNKRKLVSIHHFYVTMHSSIDQTLPAIVQSTHFALSNALTEPL